MSVPKAFISYSWDDESHKNWVKDLATRLRTDGVDVTLDRWAVVPGDQLPKFMETAVRENDFVLIVLTPNYKLKADGRKGGVGYEGDIMTGEVFAGKDTRKFIPVLRSGSWKDSSPSWLVGKYGVDLSREPYLENQYDDLLNTLHGTREKAPPIGRRAATPVSKSTASSPKHTLSSEAVSILKAAATSDGIIVAFQSDSGLAIIVDDKKFGETGDPRSEASNRDSIRTLVEARLVERDSDSSFKLTREGFAFADRLESKVPSSGTASSGHPELAETGPIKITGIIANEVGTPRNDGTRGSALYAVPFQLSRRPSHEWAEHFVRTWDNLPSLSTMHRSGIARVVGERIILDGTTVEEVANHHRDTLKMVVEKVNRDIGEWEQKQRRIAEEEAEKQRQHKKSVEDAAKRLNFD